MKNQSVLWNVGIVLEFFRMATKFPKVFPWSAFVLFVNKSFKHSSSTQVHPLVDSVALALFEGTLQRRDSKAHPVPTPRGLIELRTSWLLPSEVNELCCARQWLLNWDPGATGSVVKRKSSLLQKAKRLGWKQAMHDEANEVWRDIARLGGKPSLSEISKELHKRAVALKVVTTSGIIPSADYIKNHVISKRYWTPPK